MRNASISVYIVFLSLIACTEAPPEQPGVAVYGKPLPYLQREMIRFPDFSMRYLGNEKIADTRQVAYDADRSYQFEVTDGTEKTRVTWNDANNSKRYERFNVGGNFYFLQIKSSYFQNRELNPGELVVWDFVQFQKNAPPALKVGTPQAASRLVDLYRNYLKALQEGDWKLIEPFLSSNRKATLERSKIYAHGSGQEVVTRLAASAQGVKQFSMQRAVFSPMEARLHLVAQSTVGAQIIGILFVKEAGEWKIESETAMPGDEAGERWIALFMAQ